jgi:hypothetical protein
MRGARGRALHHHLLRRDLMRFVGRQVELLDTMKKAPGLARIAGEIRRRADKVIRSGAGGD